MKRIVTFFLSLPLLVFAMNGVQGPTMHSASESIRIRKYIDTIKAIPAIDLLKKIDSLQSEDNFCVALPAIIKELKEENAQLDKKILLTKNSCVSKECCCTYGVCLAKIGSIFCVSSYIGNHFLHWFLCSAGVMIASCQYENECKHQNNAWPELQIKRALLEQINSQSSKNKSVPFPGHTVLSHEDTKYAWEHRDDYEDDQINEQ